MSFLLWGTQWLSGRYLGWGTEGCRVTSHPNRKEGQLVKQIMPSQCKQHAPLWFPQRDKLKDVVLNKLCFLAELQQEDG